MLFGNNRSQNTGGGSASTNATNKGVAVNTQALLGPTATANVNLNNGGGNKGYNNLEAGNQMNSNAQGNSNQFGAWNTQGQFDQAQGGQGQPGKINQPPGQSGKFNQHPGQGKSPQQNQYSNGQNPSTGNQHGQANQGQVGPLTTNSPNVPYNQSPGNYPQPPSNQTNTPNNQPGDLVQQVPGPGQGQGSNPKGPGPGQKGQTDKPGNNSTANTSKNTSIHGASIHGRQQGPPPAQTKGKPNGQIQNGPGMAIATNFKSICDSTPRITYKDKNIVPWDHSKGNFVYREKDFEKLTPQVTLDEVKLVIFNNFRK